MYFDTKYIINNYSAVINKNLKSKIKGYIHLINKLYKLVKLDACVCKIGVPINSTLSFIGLNEKLQNLSHKNGNKLYFLDDYIISEKRFLQSKYFSKYSISYLVSNFVKIEDTNSTTNYLQFAKSLKGIRLKNEVIKNVKSKESGAYIGYLTNDKNNFINR